MNGGSVSNTVPFSAVDYTVTFTESGLPSGTVWYAFQDTILVDTMEMAKKYMTGVKIVTLDGDIFDASGAITGGFREKKESKPSGLF